MDSSVYTAFAHNIRLVDGVYLQESVSSYADVINALTEGGGIHTYTPSTATPSRASSTLPAFRLTLWHR